MSELPSARLYINDKPVGDVVTKREGASWSFGDFRPAKAFARFAPLFRRWSLLMHPDRGYKRLSQADRDALRQLELELDCLHAKLRFIDSGRWVACSQLNIDGRLIEWKRS